MKNISVLWYYVIIPHLLTYALKPKLCIECKFFRRNFISGNSFAKCSQFPTEEYNRDTFLIDGYDTKKRIDYSYCSIARKYSDMCGTDGKFFEKK